ncbi:MAG: hypothetical protein NTV86_17200 [Planctomycetota bacterium]|nr:hypothetical protein [Planctomycetota bacterium]
MKAMKTGRASLMADVRENRKAIRRQAGQARAAAAASLAQTARANRQRAAQTWQMLAQADKDAKARTAQTLAEAGKLVAAIDAAQILAGAGGFLSQTSTQNARLRTQTRRMLAQSRQEALAETEHLMARTRTAVSGLKTGTGRVLAEAAGTLKRLSAASRQRAAAWRDMLHGLHGSAVGATVQRPAGTKPKGKKKASAKKS